MSSRNHLFCFGLGYTASFLIASLQGKGWKISGTCRSAEKQREWQNQGVCAYDWEGASSEITAALADTTHILHSIPPSHEGDSVINRFGEVIRTAKTLKWVGYLSTTGVYGDHRGGWVDETTPVNPPNMRSTYRVAAEQAWLALAVPVHIFRLSGIYGPGRSALDAIKAGTARRIDKPGQVFSRIHVEDIVQVLLASIAHPNPGSIYNLADDEPAPQSDVVAYAASLLGLEPPPLVPFEEAALSDMARSFYGSNRRVGNDKIKRELGIALKYPGYKEGLRGLLP